MKRPNILILYTDQQRWDALGVNGNPDIITPNIDRLAAEGVNFDHHFVQSPLCMPSRLSMLTGQYPSTLRVTHMGVPVPLDTVTLPRLLQPYGYRTANIGKLHFLPHANRDHRTPHPPYGFDHLEISDEPGIYEDAYRAWVRRTAPDQLDLLSVGLPPATRVWYDVMGVQDTVSHPDFAPREDFVGATPFRGADGVTHSAFVADRTIAYLEQQNPAGQPFLCIAGFYSPHAPWVAPQRFLDLYDRDALPLPDYPPEVEAVRVERGFSDERLRSARHGYYAMISEVDYHVGRILAMLEARGLAEDTIVIFTSDHGEWLGDHLRFAKGYPGDDPVSRTPLIVRWPAGIAAPGRTASQIVEAVDILPTLLEAAGVQIPPSLQGQSLLSLLEDQPTDDGRAALMEFSGWKNLRTANFRYLVHADGREMLWDLRLDPGEYFDVAGEPAYAAELAEHRRLMLQKLVEIERPLARVWPY